MKNPTCVWRSIYNTARGLHLRCYKLFAKHAFDFLLILLGPCNFLYKWDGPCSRPCSCIFFRYTANLHTHKLRPLGTHKRSICCSDWRSLTTLHQSSHYTPTQPTQTSVLPWQNILHNLVVISGRPDSDAKVQDQRCYRCRRIGHWARSCRAPWPVTYRTNRSRFGFANAVHDNRSGGTITDGAINTWWEPHRVHISGIKQ